MTVRRICDVCHALPFLLLFRALSATIRAGQAAGGRADREGLQPE